MAKVFTGENARAQCRGLLLRLVLRGHADRRLATLARRRHLDQDLAKRHGGRLGELVLVRQVVLPRLFFGDGQLRADLVALHLLTRNCFSTFLRRSSIDIPSCASAAWNFWSSVEVLLLAEVVEPSLELLVAQVIALLLAHLEQEQLVDRIDEQLRRDLVERLLQLGVVVDHLGLRSTPSRARIAAVCRSSSSVCVKMSPFTFTSTRSMICARRGIGQRQRENERRKILHMSCPKLL